MRCNHGAGEVLYAAERYNFTPGDIITINPNNPHNFASKCDKGINYDCLIVDALFCKENGIDIDNLNFDIRINDQKACEYYDRAFKG